MKTVWICDYARTPIGRFGGVLATLRTDDLAAAALREIVRRHPGLPDVLDHVLLGCANQAGEDNRNVARMAALLTGLPSTIPALTVNRLCASGMDAVASAARMILCGEADVVLAGGVESMTRAPLVMAKAEAAFQRKMEIHDSTIGWRFINPRMREAFGVDSMPETAENVAEARGVSREDQDAFAFRSQQRTAKAVAGGRFARSLFAVEVPGPKGTGRIVGADEHPRPETTLEGLAKLKPAVRTGGTITAGNSSGVNDGAAVLLLASADAAVRWGLTPLAKISGFSAAGVEPRLMGLGPVPATKRLLKRLGWSLAAVDLLELNEAFASQALACLRELGLPDDAAHVNPCGGAISLGHPLGMSGARIVGTAAEELAANGFKKALATMCVGVGQGTALALEAP